MKPIEMKDYMKALLTALHRVHKFNIIHRDIKPSNFLYDRSNQK
jgi:cell division control protein 7